MLAKILINTSFRILYALLAGTWSDRHGRKTLLFLSVLGQLLASVSYGLNYWFLTQLSWHFLFLELINDMCGTYVSYYIAEYSFIMDVSDPSQRLDNFALKDCRKVNILHQDIPTGCD